jgi:NodT family efflux transporter outer membrane factor (OMF) lipoprotein
MSARSLVLVLALLAGGCAVGPNYKRPATAVPPEFRGAPAGGAAVSVAEQKWFDLFQDETLRQLVTTALENNFDLGIAAERVLEARAQFRIARGDQLPSVGAGASFTGSRSSSIGANTGVKPGTNLDVSYTQAGLALGWELDFWGRVRRLTEAARARYLASEEGRRGVVVSLIADVIGGYFSLRERDLELEIALKTRDIAADNLRLVRLRREHGAASGLDVHQAEQFLYIATSQIASTRRDIEQTENALSLLLGRAPGGIARGKALDQFAFPPEVPPGLPSALIERRPDIRQAEQTLIAANAQIGAAKALYFPQISLTGLLGGQSRALMDLFTGPARQWTGTVAAVWPIYSAGQIRAGVRLTEAQKREMVITYQKTIYSALREVSDALVGYGRTREQRAEEERLVEALAETTRLSQLRYKRGIDSYLQVLDAERNLFQGQLALAQLRLGEMLSFVELYRALGGGWQ